MARSHLALLAFAWSSLLRRPGRGVAVLGGLLTTITLLAAVLFTTTSLRSEAERAREVQPDLVVQHLQGGRPGLLDPATISFVTGLAGVRHAEARVWGYVFLPSERANLTIMGRRKGESDLGAVQGVIAEGRDARPDERKVAVIGQKLAELLHLRPGDMMGLPSAREDAPTFTIVGVFAAPVAFYTSDVVLTNEEDARAVLDVPAGQATDVAIMLTNPEEAPVVTHAILDQEPGLRVLDKRVLSRTFRLTYGRRAGIVLAASLPALLAMLILAWDRIGGLGAAERREIAVQKAVGWSTAEVLYAKLYESILIGFCALGAGVALAYAWVFLFSAPLLREILSGWSVLYPKVRLTPVIDPADLLGLGAMVLLPFVGISILPAWRAAILDPMQAMRS